MQVPGTLLVAGDFNTASTINISRASTSDFNLPKLMRSATASPETRAMLLDGVIARLKRQPAVFEFEVLCSDARQHEGVWYIDLEFEVSMCRGEIIEGLKGKRRYGLSSTECTSS
jgi:hypothetical protein